jgi:hypothetical protein
MGYGRERAGRREGGGGVDEGEWVERIVGRGLGKGFERCGGRWRGWGRGGVESGKGIGEGGLGL